MSRSYSTEVLPSFGFGRQDVPVTDAIVALACRLWPYKTARQLASRCGVNHRSAEHWINERSGMSGDAIVSLLRSDVGLHFMRLLMGGAQGSWWANHDAGVRAAELERSLDAIRAEIDEVKRGLV